MTVVESISLLFTINISAVIFGAGIVYNKVGKLEEEVKKYSSHSEKIAIIETEIKNIKAMQ